MAQKKKAEDLAGLSFEQAIDELNRVVAQIEDGRVPLQDCIDQYERGMALIRHCRTILQAAEKRIEQIAADQKKPAETAPDGEKNSPKDPSEKTGDELF